MRELRLTEKVTITGKNLFGKTSQLSFSPLPPYVPKDLCTSWLWRPSARNPTFIPIDLRNVEYQRRRLRLQNNARHLEIIEHIMPLRWIGIGPLVVEGCGWTPYYGRPYEYFETLESSLQETGREVVWQMPQIPVYFKHKDALCGYSEFIPQDPRLPPELRLKVTVRYPQVGQITVQRTFPSQHEFLMEDLRAYTQGLPHFLYYLSAFGHVSRLWKHHRHVEWYYGRKSSDRHKRATLHVFASHRISDLLGALALLSPTELIGGTVTSFFGGHKSDLEFINRMFHLNTPSAQG